MRVETASDTPMIRRPSPPGRRIRASQCARCSASTPTCRRPPIPQPDEHVPDFDPDYLFDRDTTLAILAGFAYNRRVHGHRLSRHRQVDPHRTGRRAAQLAVVRINLDSHVSRIDLVGKDAIVLKDGKQITEFRDGMLPWALQNNIALCFDEYDAGRPDVMFVIQRVLEVSGRLTLLDQRRVIRPHVGVPAVRDRQHGRPRRHLRPLSRHAADQPGPDGPLVDRHHAQLPAP